MKDFFLHDCFEVTLCLQTISKSICVSSYVFSPALTLDYSSLLGKKVIMLQGPVVKTRYLQCDSFLLRTDVSSVHCRNGQNSKEILSCTSSVATPSIAAKAVQTISIVKSVM